MTLRCRLTGAGTEKLDSEKTAGFINQWIIKS